MSNTTITYNTGLFGEIALPNGRCVRLIEQAYSDNYGGEAAWFAGGYLTTEVEDDENGPTVTVRWESLGAEEAEDDADWGSPAAVTHYSLGELI